MSSQSKLWVGNIDSKLSEYQLLKIFETYGKVAAYDFLYTMNTEKGSRSPRGYAFVTFESSVAANKAIQQLNNKKINGRVNFLFVTIFEEGYLFYPENVCPSK